MRKIYEYNSDDETYTYTFSSKWCFYEVGTGSVTYRPYEFFTDSKELNGTKLNLIERKFNSFINRQYSSIVNHLQRRLRIRACGYLEDNLTDINCEITKSAVFMYVTFDKKLSNDEIKVVKEATLDCLVDDRALGAFEKVVIDTVIDNLETSFDTIDNDFLDMPDVEKVKLTEYVLLRGNFDDYYDINFVK